MFTIYSIYIGLMYLIIVQSLSDIKEIVEATEELLIRLSQDRAILTKDFSLEKHNIGKHCSFNKTIKKIILSLLLLENCV